MKIINQKPKKRYLVRDVIIKPRMPKWERDFLIKKEAEEYLMLCRDGACHPVVKRVKKARHFMKWAVKLIVPDFLVGHPNLWDNLKTLRKHPNFKPLRMALAAWLIFSITFGSLGIYSLQHAVKILAASPVTDTFTDETKISSKTQITVDTVAGQVKLSVISWACGDTLTDSRNSETYATVLIGSQCWMAEHINVGTLLAGASNQTNNAVIEKYCYSDTESNCTSDGGLYQWGEAMQYAASCNGTGESQPACATPVQGICPTGWHIPSHYEYVALERTVCTSGTCATDFPYDITAAGWLGTNEGTKLKVGGSSGFEGLLAGYRSTNGSFYDRGAYASVWSSLESGTSAWSRYLDSVHAAVGRNAYDKLHGLSVRCIKD
ncbi:MAG: FISUMP domain-containing protein [Bacteroidales bacterium]|nr:FISUMP domain-containing protein [Bacteroidales bacterium]